MLKTVFIVICALACFGGFGFFLAWCSYRLRGK
jgi:hypothetical protein